MNIFPFTIDGIKNALKNPLSDEQWRNTTPQEFNFQIKFQSEYDEVLNAAAQIAFEKATAVYQKENRPLPKSCGYFNKVVRCWQEENPIRR